MKPPADARPPESLADLLRTALHDRDFRRSQAAVGELTRQPPEALPALLDGLARGLLDADGLAQRRAAQALGALGRQAAPCIPALADALRSRRWTVREAAAQALGRAGIDAEAARAALVYSTLHDRAALVRQAAAVALTQFGTQTEAARADLRQTFRHRYPRVRCRALRALAHFPGPDPARVALFQEALGDSHLKVRAAAAEVLGALGAEALPAVPALLRRLHDRNPRVHTAAAATLARLAASLPLPLQSWLRLLTRPGSSAADNLWAALECGDLPAPVRESFIETCLRRVRWHARQSPGAGSAEGEADLSAWDAACRALEAAEQAGRPGARERETVWLTACLWGQLERELGTPRSP